MTEGPPPDAKAAAAAKAARPDPWDVAARWIIDQGVLPALALITIAVALIHARIFLGETAGDDLSFHFAESARLSDCIRHGDFDFWNPSANAGYASLYYYQGVPQLASAIPAAIFGHHLFWFQLSVVLPLIAAPACAYKGMRLLGATPWQSLFAAFCVAFMNGESRWGSGNAGTFSVGLYTQTWALCVFPMALGYCVRWMRDGVHLAAATAWSGMVVLCHPFAAIALGFAVLCGWIANGPKALMVIAGFSARQLNWLKSLHDSSDDPKWRSVLGELWRGAVFAGLLIVVAAPIWMPLLIDKSGFGGFPHRVSDEVGPGFKGLLRWYIDGWIFDFQPKGGGRRLYVLTFLLPVALLFARGKAFRWLWAPSVLYVLLLGFGPKMDKIGADLFPAVRFLGALQTLCAMGIGAGMVYILTWLWNLAARWPVQTYAIRTAIASAAAAGIVLVAVPAPRALASRVRTLGDYAANRRLEMMQVNAILAAQPQGRKIPAAGAENHWWNLLSYAYDRVPTTLQMGGGGLQASPNYDFLWTQRDSVKNAWIYDAPYLVFEIAQGKNMPVGVTIGRTEHYEVRRLPTPGAVSPVTVTAKLPPGYTQHEMGHVKALTWIKGEQPLKDEVLAYVPDNGYMGPPQGKMLRAWHQDSGGSDPDIIADVENQGLTTYVVRESWHPRWHAYVDGEEVPVRRVTPDFPAVDIPAGKHTLAMRFERPWWAQVAWLLWPAAPLGVWFFSRRRARRRPTA